MLRLRFTMAASVAALLLLGGPARAATIRPASGTTKPLVCRGPTSRLGGARATPSRPVATQLRPAILVVGRPEASQPPMLLVVAAPAATPRPVCLTGLVLDPSGQPCPGVCVFPTTNTHQVAVTNAQGAFQLQVLSHAALSLQAEYVGLGSSRLTLADYSGQPVHITLGR